MANKHGEKEFRADHKAIDYALLEACGRVGSLLSVLQERGDMERQESFKKALREAIEGY
ncbi:MAG: hypothetical protein RBT11_17900 [Desulfobacterales bacterium]|jgi:hypothetical protein|nr:hypothetical protein [Desulfobacterales bacterium]